MSNKRKTIVVSGGFDPVHVGHLRMINEAASFGDVIVVLNTDAWLVRKKGYVFMKWNDRAEILKNFMNVTEVIPARDHDNTVCESLIDLKEVLDLDYFANGGDRKISNTPEMKVCESIGIEMVWNIGGGKIRSSSDLVSASEKAKRTDG
jgi:D-beta-D-heptose 7-phosphate kinase/D-beta-D-heptose 1-phosphate adenosyltransferase